MKIHPAIDAYLNEILENHCNSIEMNKQDFIAICIAKELNVPLNEDFKIDKSVYVEYKIHEIDQTISALQDKKADLEVKI